MSGGLTPKQVIKKDVISMSKRLLEICEIAEKIKKSYDYESDPFRLCKELGYELNPRHLGDSDDALKAFIIGSSRSKCIAYNADLPEEILHPIIFHEIGHGELHKGSIFAFTDFTLLDDRGVKEKEANWFCAEYMLEDDEVLEKIRTMNNFDLIAAELYIPAELLDIKLDVMRRRGVPGVPNMPRRTRNNCMGRIAIPRGYGYRGD